MRKEWWTETQGHTDAEGVYRTRAFLGEHDVRVLATERTAASSVTLGQPGATLQIALP